MNKLTETIVITNGKIFLFAMTMQKRIFGFYNGKSYVSLNASFSLRKKVFQDNSFVP